MGVGFPCWPIEGFISDEVLQPPHIVLYCLTCYQGWQYRALIKWLKIRLNDCNIEACDIETCEYLRPLEIDYPNSLTHPHKVLA